MTRAKKSATTPVIRGLGGESDSPSRELARYISDVGRSYDAGVKPLLIFRLDRFLRGGDHYSFNKEGFTAVRFTEKYDVSNDAAELRFHLGRAVDCPFVGVGQAGAKNNQSKKQKTSDGLIHERSLRRR